MSHLILYARPDCHLCEDMKDLLAAVAPQAAFEPVDIESDLGLLSRYGTRVPV